MSTWQGCCEGSRVTFYQSCDSSPKRNQSLTEFKCEGFSGVFSPSYYNQYIAVCDTCSSKLTGVGIAVVVIACCVGFALVMSLIKYWMRRRRFERNKCAAAPAVVMVTTPQVVYAQPPAPYQPPGFSQAPPPVYIPPNTQMPQQPPPQAYIPTVPPAAAPTPYYPPGFEPQAGVPAVPYGQPYGGQPNQNIGIDRNY
ncbi:hypothetical protein PPL_00763 [Heterostelium album PN500]|uniref:Uncharacterized protein n=1 Tax=Heterostelium pallidum (strain ATCC 26659 / Pp 5 / PN500) TaxID=670386 RepID=D3AXD2_HETP5|nr:hypothetical protein PPL_00763 [Heterostelium album PN500]EFA86201.1 hypothetical protein PPL_00763 [Heterostelium album PN500]|eukprot:XP_020438306.1 hypothetical protein PPL_00763 [Heterostelium album PN500]